MANSQEYAPVTQASPIVSRVAPEINPANGGVVDDAQAADTSPGSGSPPSTSPVSGSPPKKNFLKNLLNVRRKSRS